MKANHPPTTPRARQCTSDIGSAMRTKIASFNGLQFVAEREDDQLHVYMVHADPLDAMTVQDRQSIRTPADLNRHNRRAFGR